jgi:hypothetical protein
MQRRRRLDLTIALWQRRLGLEDYFITTERVSVFQVSDDFCAVGNSLVGVCADQAAKTAIIYHTRQIRQEEVVHELLHVRFPFWSEDEVNNMTVKLLRAVQHKMPLLTIFNTSQKY